MMRSIWKNRHGELFRMRSIITNRFDDKTVNAHITLVPLEGIQYIVVCSWPVFKLNYKPVKTAVVHSIRESVKTPSESMTNSQVCGFRPATDAQAETTYEEEKTIARSAIAGLGQRTN